MKTGLLIAFLIGACFTLAAQEIDSHLYQKTWIDKEVRVFHSYSITKEFGHNPHAPSAYNVLPITAISYKGIDELKKELREKALEEKWPEEEILAGLRDIEFSSGGGELQIYISRYDQEVANFRWFFVILRGEEDKGKLWEHELGYQAAEVPYERGWWNYTTVPIPIEIKLPFYVYFNDKQSEFLSDFKFRVEKTNLETSDAE